MIVQLILDTDGIDKAENELVKVQITDFSDHTLRSHAERLAVVSATSQAEEQVASDAAAEKDAAPTVTDSGSVRTVA